jgi:hypothetical protein
MSHVISSTETYLVNFDGSRGSDAYAFTVKADEGTVGTLYWYYFSRYGWRSADYSIGYSSGFRRSYYAYGETCIAFDIGSPGADLTRVVLSVCDLDAIEPDFSAAPESLPPLTPGIARDVRPSGVSAPSPGASSLVAQFMCGAGNALPEGRRVWLLEEGDQGFFQPVVGYLTNGDGVVVFENIRTQDVSHRLSMWIESDGTVPTVQSDLNMLPGLHAILMYQELIPGPSKEFLIDEIPYKDGQITYLIFYLSALHHKELGCKL